MIPNETLLALFLTSIVLLIIGTIIAVSYARFAVSRARLHLKKEKEFSFQLRALNQHAIVSIADSAGNIIYVNDKFCEVSGYQREEVLGQNHRIMGSGDHPKEFFEEMWRTISSGNAWHGEIKNRKKNGDYYWVQSSIIPFMNENGKPEKYFAIRTDVTEGYEAQFEKNKKLKRAMMQFRSTIELYQDAIQLFWPDSLKFFYGNKAAMKQIGSTEREFTDLTPFDLYPDLDQEIFRSNLKKLVLGMEKTITFETPMTDETGNIVFFEQTLAFIRPKNEKPYFVAVLRNISGRKAAELAKSEFISTVSHELRTPLTSIKGALGLIKTGAFGELPDNFQKMLNIANNNSDRLVVLINDILDMEKLEAGKMSFQMQPMDLSALIEEALVNNKGLASQYQIKFVSSGTEEPIFTIGDKVRLMQVLDNLLSNAAKFSPSGSRVEVGLERLETCLRITIKDYGSGIPKKARETIFDKFVQADSSDQRQQGGTGLGLAISKTIIEQHHGLIEFNSEIGTGSTFYVELPVLSKWRMEHVPGEITDDRILHLLICEPDPDVSMHLKEFLEEANYRTSLVSTANEALHLLEQNQFDGIIMDLALPDKNGILLIQEIRRNPKFDDLPVVVVSAGIDGDGQQLNGGAIGLAEWIEKPIDISTLSSKLKRALYQVPQIIPRILHIEDARSICLIISSMLGEQVSVISVGTVHEARELLAKEKFDLVILDLGLPDGEGQSLLPLLKIPPQESPPVVIFAAGKVSSGLTNRFQKKLRESSVGAEDILQIIQSTIKGRHAPNNQYTERNKIKYESTEKNTPCRG